MIEALAGRLRLCRTERDLWPIASVAEALLTPGELAGLGRLASFPPVVRAWIVMLSEMAGLGDAPPQRYLRQALHPHLTMFADPAAPRARKRLIIGFTGARGRLMLPAAAILQRLPSERYDLALIEDVSRDNFLNGIEGYAGNTLDLAKALVRDLDPRAYIRTFCCGVSLGGFAALRAAIVIRADRGISVGGRFPWHPHRLRVKAGKTVPAFDPLCDCNREFQGELISVYSDNETDRNHAERLAATLDVNSIPIRQTADHNVFHALLQRGELDALFGRLFDLDHGNAKSWAGVSAPAPGRLPQSSPAGRSASHRRENQRIG